eukprot:Hpha_TRINITY_DN37203_c0_g1::TRINITY_DN37203_c0_g1_i1::g.85203::m.85203
MENSAGGCTGIEFAPVQHGLKLAFAGGTNGVVVLSAQDINVLGSQQLGFGTKPIVPQVDGARVSVSCLSWNPSCSDECAMLALGTECGRVMIYACDKESRWSQVNCSGEGGGGLELLQKSPLDHPRGEAVSD